MVLSIDDATTEADECISPNRWENLEQRVTIRPMIPQAEPTEDLEEISLDYDTPGRTTCIGT